MLLPEVQQPSNGCAQDNQNTPVTEPTALPPHYVFPQTLRNWPWPRNVSPHHRACEPEVAAWFESFNPSPQLSAGLKKADACLLCALTFPRSTHFQLRSCSEMMCAFFMVDENTANVPIDVVVDRCEASMDAILHVDKPRPEGEHVLGELTRQFWKRASSGMPRVVIERFETSWRKYIDAIIRQTQYRSQKYICTPEEYMDARCDEVGAYPCFAMMEETLELNIPHEIMEHPYLQSLNKYTSQMIFLDNDLASYKKEILADEADYNSITVVQKHLKSDLESAVQWLFDYYEQIIDNFLALREKVLKKDGFPSCGPRIDREVADYVDGLGNWVRGNNEWHFGSRRYFGDGGLEVQRDRKVVLA